MLSIIIYGLVLAFKSGSGEFFIIILIVNIIGGSCIPCLCIPIATYLLYGFNFYVLFYSMQSKIDPISLLLFWSDLWTTLFAIYVAIEKCISGEKVDDEEIKFNIHNIRNYTNYMYSRL